MSDAPIERFFEAYAERYMASDADAIVAMYEVPFLAVREGRTIGDAEAVREHLVALMEAYRNAGATRATIAELQITQLDRTSAIATVRWNALPTTERSFAISPRATRCSARSPVGGGSSRTRTTTNERRDRPAEHTRPGSRVREFSNRRSVSHSSRDGPTVGSRLRTLPSRSFRASVTEIDYGPPCISSGSDGAQARTLHTCRSRFAAPG